MKMVIYGIGKFESYENPNYQIGLAILMQRDFKWIGDIEVFDPALSMNECQILKALGCSVLEFDEDGKRKSLKPTVFFMPHCPIMLYDNLLQANWKPSLLSNVVIFGNSFGKYASYASSDYNEDSKDTGLGRNRQGGGAFHCLSWHFFHPFYVGSV
ncbi:hypothetical protein QN277_025879 [Acacia crassicarpa]|uniref:SRR1-like domain-containing protein n=1 Tax=Acacia crassicarpa TaxID=499986 RepID=A0AAE1J6F9_9FABA|nr:hypothetical protein QN277_025879 [Acacia crassicarpa]